MDTAAATESAATRQKALGAFYTPFPMAQKIVEWAVRSPADRVLDPSFGGLVFLRAAQARMAGLGLGSERSTPQLYGCDLDEDAHDSAAVGGVGLAEATLVCRDFLALEPGKDLPVVEAVVGNPPYVRYQLHNGAGASGQRVARAAGLNLTRLASSWAPFVLHSTDFVAPGGRLALVLPAELMHAQYAGEVLAWVQRRFARTALVVFEQRVFPGALEEVVLLFADGRAQGVSGSVGVVECKTLADLDLEVLERHLETLAASKPSRGKLLGQLLAAPARELYDRLADDPRVIPLGEIGSVDIGVVTGANEFFLRREGEEPGMSRELLKPAVSKAAQVRGARFATRDLEALRTAGARCLLFVAEKHTPDEVLETAKHYLRRGEGDDIPDRYKCRVREPWFALPLPRYPVPDLFLTYCSAEFPRLVANDAGALHTNTLHGVRLLPGALEDPRALAVGFYNSLTLLSAELVGRSYGGGVLKLEPTEAEGLVLPPIPEELARELDQVDALLRARRVDDVLELVDRVVLVDGLGLSGGEVESLRAGAERLRSRRRARGRAPK